jgi:hypothetical protein
MNHRPDLADCAGFNDDGHARRFAVTAKKNGPDKVYRGQLPDFANSGWQAGAATTVRSF